MTSRGDYEHICIIFFAQPLHFHLTKSLAYPLPANRSNVWTLDCCSWSVDYHFGPYVSVSDTNIICQLGGAISLYIILTVYLGCNYFLSLSMSSPSLPNHSLVQNSSLRLTACLIYSRFAVLFFQPRSSCADGPKLVSYHGESPRVASR